MNSTETPFMYIPFMYIGPIFVTECNIDEIKHTVKINTFREGRKTAQNVREIKSDLFRFI